MRAVTWLLVAAASVMAGCGRDYAMRCEDPERYAGEQEVPPVRVPDDLDVPDETEALRIPPPRNSAPDGPTARRGPCLESPPSYYGESPEQEASATPPDDNGGAEGD